MSKRTKQIISSLLCLTVCFPAFVLALLVIAFRGIADFLEWCYDGRWIARKTFELCDRIEAYWLTEE